MASSLDFLQAWLAVSRSLISRIISYACGHSKSDQPRLFLLAILGSKVFRFNGNTSIICGVGEFAHVQLRVV